MGELLDKRIPLLTIAVLGCFLITRSAGLAQTLTVMQPTTSAVSPPLSQIPNGNNTHGNTAHAHRPVPSHVGAGGSQADTALQTSAGPLINATGGTNFDGAGVNGFAPPDANIAVGPNHIFEAVNSAYTSYDHSGRIAGAARTAAICDTISCDRRHLPADVHGSNAALDGTPGYSLNLEPLSSLRMYKLSPHFANSAASTLTFAQDLTVTGFK